MKHKIETGPRSNRVPPGCARAKKPSDRVLHLVTPEHVTTRQPVSPEAKQPDPAAPTTRPTIQVEHGQIPRMVREAIAALAHGAPNLYQRASELVELVREPERMESYDSEARGHSAARDERVGADIIMRPGTPRLRGLPRPTLLLRLAEAATWNKRDGRRGGDEDDDAWVPTDPPGNVVGMVHASANWPGIRPIRGILEAPSLRPDGSLIEANGYDQATGFLLLPTCKFPAVSPKPSRTEAAEALRRLWINIFCDFSFQGLGASGPDDPDRMQRYERACRCADAFVGVAALLTIIARPAIQGATPGFVHEAATQGSGKTLQLNAVSIVATGRSADVMTFPMGRNEPNEEELEKVLGAYALAGKRVIAFDNIKGTIGGPALEKCMTTVDKIDLRVLGASALRTMPWSAILLFSGNNMTMTADMAQHVLVSRLESTLEDPRSRSAKEFLYGDLLAALRESRPSLVRDALTVLRAFLVAPTEERPDCGTWGSFDPWTRLVPPAIRYAGGPNVLDARPRVGELAQDTEAEAHLILMRQWPGDQAGSKAADVLSYARDDMRAAIRTLTKTPDGKPLTATSLGIALAKLRGKIRGGLRLMARKDRNDVSLWSVEDTKPKVATRGDRPALCEGCGCAKANPTNNFEACAC